MKVNSIDRTIFMSFIEQDRHPHIVNMHDYKMCLCPTTLKLQYEFPENYIRVTQITNF